MIGRSTFSSKSLKEIYILRGTSWFFWVNNQNMAMLLDETLLWGINRVIFCIKWMNNKQYQPISEKTIETLVFIFCVFRRAPRPTLFLKVKNAPCLFLKVKIAPCPFLEVKNVLCLFSGMKNKPCPFSTISRTRKLDSCWKSENAI